MFSRSTAPLRLVLGNLKLILNGCKKFRQGWGVGGLSGLLAIAIVNVWNQIIWVWNLTLDLTTDNFQIVEFESELCGKILIQWLLYSWDTVNNNYTSNLCPFCADTLWSSVVSQFDEVSQIHQSCSKPEGGLQPVLGINFKLPKKKRRDTWCRNIYLKS